MYFSMSRFRAAIHRSEADVAVTPAPTTAHRSSLSSHRPVTGASRQSRAAPGSHEIAPQLFM